MDFENDPFRRGKFIERVAMFLDKQIYKLL
jgi:hypothetical protein